MRDLNATVRVQADVVARECGLRDRHDTLRHILIDPAHKVKSP